MTDGPGAVSSQRVLGRADERRNVAEDLNAVLRFLARRDELPPSAPQETLVVLPGAAVLEQLGAAAELVTRGYANKVLCTGGVGHSTEFLRARVAQLPWRPHVRDESRSEGEIFRDLLVGMYGLPEPDVLVESLSVHTGENASRSHGVLLAAGLLLPRVILIQDPLLQRRAHETFLATWRRLGYSPDIFSHAPFVPAIVVEDGWVVLDEVSRQVWTAARLLGLVRGELVKLTDDEHGYGPRGTGWIDHVDIPPEVAVANQQINRLVAEQ